MWGKFVLKKEKKSYLFTESVRKKNSFLWGLSYKAECIHLKCKCWPPLFHSVLLSLKCLTFSRFLYTFTRLNVFCFVFSVLARLIYNFRFLKIFQNTVSQAHLSTKFLNHVCITQTLLWKSGAGQLNMLHRLGWGWVLLVFRSLMSVLSQLPALMPQLCGLRGACVKERDVHSLVLSVDTDCFKVPKD